MKNSLLRILLIVPLMMLGASCGSDEGDTGGDTSGETGGGDGSGGGSGDGSGGGENGGMEAGTLLEEAAADGRFGTLLGAIDTAGLTSTLEGAGPFTIFAPTDDAFDNLPAGVVASLTAEQLGDILKFHVAGMELDSTAVAASELVTTVLDGEIFIIQTIDDNIVLNGTTQLVEADIEASNGVIHAIDSVMLPIDFPGTVVDLLNAYPIFSALSGALTSEALATPLSTSSAVTVFAPLNSAFEAIDLAALPMGRLNEILRYHAVAGALNEAALIAAANLNTLQGTLISVMVQNGGADIILNGTTYLTYTDLQATNGVVHIVDSVLMP